MSEAAITLTPLFDRDNLGRLVREAWVRWAISTGAVMPSEIQFYDELGEDQKEADRQIGEAVVQAVMAHFPPPRARHPDNDAVDQLAARMLGTAMKNKLGRARDKGRGGWDDEAACSNADLSRMLREHVDKGDPVDVANFCAFLFARGERILPAEDETERCPICAEPLKPGDTCATDITEGTCHAACLDGAAVVYLDTGEPSEGPIDTFTYQPDEERGL